MKKFREIAKCSGSIVECFQAAVDTDACLILWEWGLRKSHCSCYYQRVWTSIYVGVGTDKQASLGVHAYCLAHARERGECDKMWWRDGGMEGQKKCEGKKDPGL